MFVVFLCWLNQLHFGLDKLRAGNSYVINNYIYPGVFDFEYGTMKILLLVGLERF